MQLCSPGHRQGVDAIEHEETLRQREENPLACQVDEIEDFRLERLGFMDCSCQGRARHTARPAKLRADFV